MMSVVANRSSHSLTLPLDAALASAQVRPQSLHRGRKSASVDCQRLHNRSRLTDFECRSFRHLSTEVLSKPG